MLVIDADSPDGTVEVAREHDAWVVTRTGDGGKGEAVQEAVEAVDVEYVLMLDGDESFELGG